MPFSAVLVTGTGTFLIRSRAVLLWCEGCGLLCCLRWCSGSSCRVLGGVPLLGVGCSFLLMGGGSGLCFRPSVVAVRLGFPRFVCCLVRGVFLVLFLWVLPCGAGLVFLLVGAGLVFLSLFVLVSLLLSLSLLSFCAFLCLLVLGWLWFLVCGFWVGVVVVGAFF